MVASPWEYEDYPDSVRNVLLLKRCYEKYCNSSKAVLFRTFETYLDSLPTREHPTSFGFKKLCLCKYSYLARNKDIEYLSQQLLVFPVPVRSVVNYIAAPSGSGKSACILPAFLQSQNCEIKFTHYLYLAFDNNDKRCFTAMPENPDRNLVVAEAQGANFVFKCLHVLLNTPDDPKAYFIQLQQGELPSVEETRESIALLLQDLLGEGFKCLVHIDEHRYMCARDGDSEKSGAAFARGAMQTLARVSGVTVVATFVDLPPLPPLGSSRVCRRPVVLPTLDINKVIDAVTELQFKYPDLSALSLCQQRLLATLRFRLAMKIAVNLGVVAVLHERNSWTYVEDFLRKFQTAGEIEDVTKSLTERSKLCALEMSNFPDLDIDCAARLLVGIPEKSLSSFDPQVPALVLLTSNRFSSGLLSLLTMNDLSCPVYNIGRRMMRAILTSKAVDYLSQNPLEVAYIWSLSCRSHTKKEICFFPNHVNCSFSIECADVKPARLFPDTDSSIYNCSGLTTDVLYFADEGKGKTSHPLADLFFVTNKKELVLIDVTGGGREVVDKKVTKLSEWIMREKLNLGELTPVGVVLAPLDESQDSSYDSDTGIIVVCGEDARVLLEGLSQCFDWFVGMP